MKINVPKVEENPSDGDIHFLDDRINEYNFETTGIRDGRVVSFLLRGRDASIIAGLYGWTWGRCCEVRYLWVRQDCRKRGYGKALMVAAEHEAATRGCAQIVLDTHDFQAVGFYQGLGFEIIGTCFDYPRGHQKHYLIKRLAELN
jgi:ribosomal protein S18 acetylase RimI-like enzyme